MTSPTFGGWKGTDKLIDLLNLKDLIKNRPKILEVGCSTGYITQYMAHKCNCEIIGVDLSKILIEIASDEAKKSNITNISFQEGNVENLPFFDNSFDIVYGEAITALVSDPLKVIKEYMRVLKPGGKIGTVDLFMKDTLNDYFKTETSKIMSNVLGTQIKIRNLQEWEQIFQQSGLKEIQIYDYYEDLFKRDFKFGRLVILMFKLFYYMIVNKEIRQKIIPTLKFAKKFKKVLKGNHFGYLVFIGTKK